MLKLQQGLLDEWRLVIAGQGLDRYETGIRRLMHDLGLDESVAFIGPVYGNEKRDVLLQADAFVLPSGSEGLPMAVLEAWSYGLPVVMTPQCNLPEGFEAGAAIEVEPDTNSIAKGLASLFSLSASDRARMGANGRRLVESKFNWPDMACEMMCVYRWIQGAGEQPACVRMD
jgi:glycosyltransferase involved in cell wall biosynthesis